MGKSQGSRDFATPRSNFAVIGTVAILFWSSQASAYPIREGEYAFWRDMPETTRVVSDVRGRNEVDTAARRHAAFSLLIALVNVSADGKGQMPWPKREVALNGAYFSALADIVKRMGNSAEFHAKAIQYRGDQSFTRPFLRRYFSEAALREIEPMVSAFEKRAQEQIAKSRADQLNEFLPRAALSRFGINTTHFLLFAVGFPLVLLALWLAREMFPFGLDSSDPLRLRSGWSHYYLNTITGMVLSPTKSHVVTTYRSGGGSYVSGGVVYQEPSRTSTTETIRDQFFVRDTNGREEAFQLKDVDIALREGHALSVAWGVKKRKKGGYSFLFRNHSTRRVDFMNGVMRDMLKPNKWLALPLLIVAPIWGAWLLETNDYARSMDFGAQLGWLLAGVVATLFVFFFVRERVVNLRVRRLKRQIADRLLPILDKRAAEQITTSSGGATLKPT